MMVVGKICMLVHRIILIGVGDGQISILRMYNGKALTANEVKRNYNADAAKFGLTPI